MNHRPDRVGGLIQAELGKILLKEVEFPNALVTITSVDVDKKLENAKIKVGVVPSQKSDAILKTLAYHQGNLQFTLNRKLNIRPMPRIEFVLDHGVENAAQVEKILIQEDNKGVL